jgi:hypothetical protein
LAGTYFELTDTRKELNNRVKKAIDEESYFIYYMMENGGANMIKQYLNNNPELLIEKIKQIKEDQYNDKIIEVFGSALAQNVIENMKK